MRCILSSQNAATIWSARGDAQNATVDRASAEAEMSEMRDLLGRLHNQKNWFRPKTGHSYIGG